MVSVEEKSTQIKQALQTSFVTDKFMIYKQFLDCHLYPGEFADIYLVDLQRSELLFEGISEQSGMYF